MKLLVESRVVKLLLESRVVKTLAESRRVKTLLIAMVNVVGGGEILGKLGKVR